MSLTRTLRGLALLASLLGARAEAQYPPVVTRSRLDPNAGVGFHAVLLSDTVYVGQQATYQIGVFLNQETRQRLRRNPEFIPPETRSLLVYDLPDAKAPLVGTIDGRQYEVHVFQRAFFALTPGTYVIPPSQLNYSLPQSASFFSREDSHTLRSESRTLVVLPAPLGGRPATWGGAVGEWRAVLRADSSRGRVGTPIVVTLKVGGLGNVALLPRPPLVVDGATVVPAGDRVSLDSTPTTLRGAKEFDWLVTPRAGGTLRIPAQAYSYFDPLERRYAQATTEALSLSISGEADPSAAVDSLAPAPVAPAAVASATPVLTVREAIGGDAVPSWGGTLWFALLLVLAPVPAIAGWLARRPRRAKRAPTAADRLQAASTLAPDARRTLVHAALRERLQLDAGLLLARGELVTALRHEGVSIETAQKANAILRTLDASVFGTGTAGTSQAELVEMYRAIDAEARAARPAAARTRGLVTATVLLLGVGAAANLRAQSSASSLQRAREAYAAQDYATAARTYRALAREAPRRADLWANAGTAAFLAADTAHAVEGWQRALRLSPLDQELRDRLALVRAAQDRGPARVWPINVAITSLLVLLCWLAGWGVLARRAWRGQRVGGRILIGLAVGAIALFALRRLDRSARGVDTVVIAQAEPLRALPALGADRGVAPLVGEIAHVIERKGPWALVRLDGDREGWIPTEWLIPLGD